MDENKVDLVSVDKVLFQEILSELRCARSEILTLRKQCNMQQARLDTLDIIAAVTGMRRAPGGESVDVAWSIDRLLNRLAPKLTPTAEDV